MHHQPVFGRRRVLAIAAGLTALVAAGGATGLVGGFIDIGDRLQSRLPFASPVFGGVALALIVALPFAILAGRAWSGRPGTGAAAVFAGALLVGWIVVEVAFLRELSFLHPLCVVVGGAVVVVGLTRRGAIEHPVDADAVERFLRQHRIALVGASADTRKFGNTVFRALRDHGYEVVPINSRSAEIEGTKCHARVADVVDEIDAAMLMVTGAAAVDAVRECAARGIHHVWLFRGVGSPGAVSTASVAACRQHGLDAVVGACPLMFLQPVESVHRVHLAVRRFNRECAPAGSRTR